MVMSSERLSLYFGVGITFAGSLLFYSYIRSNRRLHHLQELKEYSIDDALLHKLKTEGPIEYGAISGNVSPDSGVLHALHCDAVGVVRKVTVIEQITRRKSNGETWLDDARVISCDWSHIPFSLIGLSTYLRGRVTEPLNADVIDLRTVYSWYDPRKQTIGESLLNYVNGVYVKGIQTVEEMLCPDTKLTVVGKVTLSESNEILLLPPDLREAQYILTTKSLKVLAAEQQSWVSINKIFAIAFLTVGSFLLLYWLYKVTLNLIEKNRYKKLTIENMVRHNSVCVVCVERQRNVVIIPCGHVCSCKECAKVIKICPICRTVISTLVPIYVS